MAAKKDLSPRELACRLIRDGFDEGYRVIGDVLNMELARRGKQISIEIPSRRQNDSMKHADRILKQGLLSLRLYLPNIPDYKKPKGYAPAAGLGMQFSHFVKGFRQPDSDSAPLSPDPPGPEDGELLAPWFVGYLHDIKGRVVHLHDEKYCELDSSLLSILSSKSMSLSNWSEASWNRLVLRPMYKHIKKWHRWIDNLNESPISDPVEDLIKEYDELRSKINSVMGRVKKLRRDRFERLGFFPSTADDEQIRSAINSRKSAINRRDNNNKHHKSRKSNKKNC